MSDTCLDFFFASIIGLTAWFFGGMDGFIKVLLAFSVVDYLSGVAVAYVERSISSRVGFNGILRKCVMFSLVGVANLLDEAFLNNSDTIRTAVVLFYIGNEGFSIMENAYKLNVPFPKVLQDRFLEFMKNKEHENHAHEKINNKAA